MKKQGSDKSRLFDWLLIAVTFVGLVSTALIFHQQFIKLLPCLISLFVMVLQSRANRYGYLLGGLNSLVYAAGYYLLGLYSSMTYAVAFSFPMQVAIFIRWSRHPYKKSTIMRRTSVRVRVTAAAGFIAAWTVCYFILRHFGSSYILFDNTVTLLGIASTFLAFFAYIESNYVSAVCVVVNLVMFVVISLKTPENITYVVYSAYSLIRVLQGLVNWQKIYFEQQAGAVGGNPDAISTI